MLLRHWPGKKTTKRHNTYEAYLLLVSCWPNGNVLNFYMGLGNSYFANQGFV